MNFFGIGSSGLNQVHSRPGIAPLVEGHGEVQAVPALIGRLHPELRVARPWRFTRNDFKRAIDATATQYPGYSILLLMDCEDALPCEFGPQLQARMMAHRPDLQVRVALAYREFETWFLAGGSADITPHPDPESIRDAKGEITRKLGRKYSPRVDQLRYVRQLDIERARVRSHSFARFGRILDELAR